MWGIKKHRTKPRLSSLILAALVSGGLIAGSGTQVQADTIGDILENSTLHVVNDSSTGNIPEVKTTAQSFPNAVAKPWSMYEIPGLGRNRTPKEGSFVRWGYNGWPGASAGMPLSTDVSAGGSGAVSQTTADWKNGTTASAVAISFSNTGTGNGKPYFALNYVDKDDLVDFGSSDNAPQVTRNWANQTVTAADRTQIFNSNNVVSKMKSSDGTATGTPRLDTANATFDGGYLQATGNVPISAAVANSQSLADSTMAGNWAVMVRVQVAKGIDAKALAASVDWHKSYYYLTIKTISIAGVSFTINFPMQFDHHIYLDPKNSQNFFLKVKGLPFWAKQLSPSQPSWWPGQGADDTKSTVQLQLQDGDADYVDYLNNRQINAAAKTASTLDNLVDAKGNVGPGTSMDDDQLTTTDVNGAKQPAFAIYKHFQGSLLVPATGTPLWNIYDVTGVAPPPLGPGPKSALYNAGPTGRMITLLNAIAGDTQTIPERIYGSGLSSAYTAILNWFTNTMFTGSAHINFSFDMSKYAAGTSQKEQALTAGRFFAAPKADGSFNSSSGMAATDAVQITMYDSSQLVDPYSLTKGLDRKSTSRTSTLRQTLHTDQSSALNATKAGPAGMTPADYAVIDQKEVENRTRYPTYTNYTSWTGAIMPYDRMHWTDDTDDSVDTTFTDAMHAPFKLQKTGTISPDLTQDGILINGSTDPFTILARNNLVVNQMTLRPTFTDPNRTKLAVAGAVPPQRFANVYQFYDYNSDGTATENIKPIYTSAANNLSVAVAAQATPTAKSSVNLVNKQVTNSLDGRQWKYTGTMNSGGATALPLAQATVNLAQSLKPRLDLSGGTVYTVNDTDLKKEGGITKFNGTYHDPLAIVGNDTLQAVQSSNNTYGQDQTARWAKMDVDTNAHDMSFNVANNNPYDNDDPNVSDATKNVGAIIDSSSNVLFKYQMPARPDPNARMFYGSLLFSRIGAVSVAGGNSLPASVDGTATASYLVFRNQDIPDTAWYTTKKYFTATKQTRQFVQSTDSSYGVTADVTSTGQGTNYSKTLTILIPKLGNNVDDKNPTYPTVNPLPTVKGTGEDANNAATVTAGSSNVPGIKDNYYVYNVAFARAPKTFTYNYTYKINSGGFPADYYNKGLIDVIESGTQMLAQSNPIYFAAFQNVNLVSVPSMDFGQHPTPGTIVGNYLITSDSTSSSMLAVQDNRKTLGSWSVSGTLGQFTNQDTNAGYANFRLALGRPALDTQGTGEGLSDPSQTTPPTQPGDYTNSEQAFVNHTPGTMVAGGKGAKIYTLNRLVEPDAASSITRYYPAAQLTIPADIGPTVTKGHYVSTITYTVQDDASL